MIIKRTAIMFVSAATLAFAYPVFAAGDHDHDKAHDHGKAESHFQVTPPADVKAAWALLSAKVAASETALQAKDVQAAHEASEHMEAAVHTLQDKSDVPADAKAKLASALKQLDKAVDEIHHSTEEKDADAASAAIGKIKGLLPVVEGLYPAGTLK